MNNYTDQELTSIAHTVRRDIVEMVHTAGSGHLGGSLSAVEILVALYFRYLKAEPNNPLCATRDRFILSKGHATPVYYSVLARRGYFPLAELSTFRCMDSRLQGHPDMKKTPGVDFSSGSLGQGLSVGGGMAWGIKQQGTDSKVYVLLGDGELNEGQNWEAAMSASKLKLNNLVAILDHNKVQLDGMTDTVMPLGSVADKFRVFGWETTEIDGHDIAQISAALDIQSVNRPRVIIAHTVKGKGISFMEHDHRWHGKPMNTEEYQSAIAELSVCS